MQDRRNLLVVRAAHRLPDEQAVTLRVALERAVEAEFQLEDSEIDSRELPDQDERGRFLLTEAAEGGAGVLARIIEDPGALARVARRALEIIHYEPGTGRDLHMPPGGTVRCERGCYDCLLSYGNQYEHTRINRHAIVDLLTLLTTARVEIGAGGRPREEQAEWLARLGDSSLEAKFIAWLTDTGRRLPDDAQRTLDELRVRPDFIYDLPGNPVALFIDGPHHDTATQQQRDDGAVQRLTDASWFVVRFRHDDDWSAVADRYEWLFGPGRSATPR